MSNVVLEGLIKKLANSEKVPVIKNGKIVSNTYICFSEIKNDYSRKED